MSASHFHIFFNFSKKSFFNIFKKFFFEKIFQKKSKKEFDFFSTYHTRHGLTVSQILCPMHDFARSYSIFSKGVSLLMAPTVHWNGYLRRSPCKFFYKLSFLFPASRGTHHQSLSQFGAFFVENEFFWLGNVFVRSLGAFPLVLALTLSICAFRKHHLTQRFPKHFCLKIYECFMIGAFWHPFSEHDLLRSSK